MHFMERLIEKFNGSTCCIREYLLGQSATAIDLFRYASGYRVLPVRDIFFAQIPVLGQYRIGTDYLVLSSYLLETSVSMEFSRSVMLHELAHYICFACWGESGHSKRFAEVASVIHAPEAFAHPSVSLDLAADTSSQLSKIKKLLALGDSSNPYESRNAMEKARKLMAGLGIKHISSDFATDTVYSAVLASMDRCSVKEKVLTYLCDEIAGVYSVLERLDKGCRVRIFGTVSQVEVACYVYDYLEGSLSAEYKAMRKQGMIKGRALSSFYNGVYAEMSKRFDVRSVSSDETARALTKVHDDNRHKAESCYYGSGVLHAQHRSYYQRNEAAYAIGKKVGQHTHIRKAVTVSSSGGRLLE
jgi:hypothetical protein